jgi:hypothetical protein
MRRAQRKSRSSSGELLLWCIKVVLILLAFLPLCRPALHEFQEYLLAELEPKQKARSKGGTKYKRFQGLVCTRIKSRTCWVRTDRALSLRVIFTHILLVNSGLRRLLGKRV